MASPLKLRWLSLTMLVLAACATPGGREIPSWVQRGLYADASSEKQALYPEKKAATQSDGAAAGSSEAKEGVVVAAAKPPARPAAAAAEDAEENLLAEDAPPADAPPGASSSGVGATGSFGSRLESLIGEFEPFIHAYATLEAVYQPFLASGAPNPKLMLIDPRYFNVFVGGSIGPFQPEVQIELEHGSEIAARFAQVDYVIDRALVIRAGIFLVPFGVYNEYYYPEYVRPLPRRPMMLVLDQVIPVVWNDVGLQIRGKGDLGPLGWNYALYVGNGLQLRAGKSATNLRDMRGNLVESVHSNKAFGGRVGFSFGDLNFGASFNRGAYTDNPLYKITFVGADFHVEKDDYGILAEYAWSAIDRPGTTPYVKHGASTQVHYAITKVIRPALAVDVLFEPDATVPTARVRPMAILAVYPAPDLAPKTSFRLAAGRDFKLYGALPSRNVTAMVQVATAF